jgi:hypothetical protein
MSKEKTSLLFSSLSPHGGPAYRKTVPIPELLYSDDRRGSDQLTGILPQAWRGETATYLACRKEFKQNEYVVQEDRAEDSWSESGCSGQARRNQTHYSRVGKRNDTSTAHLQKNQCQREWF